MTGEGPGKAVAIVFAGEHGINGGSQHLQTKLRHKGAMRFIIGIIVWQWSNAQPLGLPDVNPLLGYHQRFALGKSCRQPLLATLRAAVRHFRARITDKEDTLALVEGRPDDVLVSQMQGRKLAHNKSGGKSLGHRGAAPAMADVYWMIFSVGNGWCSSVSA